MRQRRHCGANARITCSTYSTCGARLKQIHSTSWHQQAAWWAVTSLRRRDEQQLSVVFLSLQDEKNQIMKSNVWLRMVSFDSVSAVVTTAFSDCPSFECYQHFAKIDVNVQVLRSCTGHSGFEYIRQCCFTIQFMTPLIRVETAGAIAVKLGQQLLAVLQSLLQKKKHATPNMLY